MAPNTRRVGFPVHHFVRIYTYKSKTKGRTLSGIERLLYYRKYLFSWIELYVRYHRRVMDSNTHRNHFSICRFVRTCTRNSKTTGCIWTFYIANDCPTIADVYFLCWSWIRDTNGDLRFQTRIAVSF